MVSPVKLNNWLDKGESIMELNKQAYIRLESAQEAGICKDSESEIVDIVLEQEIVSYCTSKGCVSFDYDDLMGEW